MISLAEFAPLSVEDGSRQFMTIFAFVEFRREISLYGEQTGIPVEGQPFIDGLRTQLQAAASWPMTAS